MGKRGRISNASGEGKKRRGGRAHKEPKVFSLNMTMSDSFFYTG